MEMRGWRRFLARDRRRASQQAPGEVLDDSISKKLYFPLNFERSEIRVFKLIREEHGARGNGNLPIRCSMTTISLDDRRHTSFNALSYVWGEPIHQRIVFINEIEVRVTENLFLALDDLLRAGSNAYWWVDALCIDQSNLEERSSQVQMMSRIYMSTARTIAHLGSFRAAPALELLEKAAASRNLGRDPGPWMSKAVKDPKWAQGWKCLNEMLDVPYWSRAWILQELTVSLRIEVFNSGGPNLNVEELMRAFMAILLTQDSIRQPLWDTYEISLGSRFLELQQRLGLRWKFYPGRRAKKAHPVDFAVALSISLPLKATDPRDHLYAILAMVGDKKAVVGLPDYSIEAEEVFARFVQGYYHQYGSLDMILLRSSNPGRVKDAPSWVPNLSGFEDAKNTNTILRENFANADPAKSIRAKDPNKPFRASGLIPATATFSPNLRVLKARGVYLGRIASLGGCSWLQKSRSNSTEPAGEERCQVRWTAWTGLKKLSPVSVMEAVAQSLTFATLPRVTNAVPSGLLGQLLTLSIHALLDDDLQSTFSYGLKKWWDLNKDLTIGLKSLYKWMQELLRDRKSLHDRRWQLQWKLMGGTLKTLDKPLSQEDVFESFLGRLSHVTLEMRRRLMMTSNGLIGLAPVHCKLEDEVWVLHGCSLPIILRKVEMEEYNVIGESFVHGCMAGEVVQETWREVKDCTLH